MFGNFIPKATSTYVADLPAIESSTIDSPEEYSTNTADPDLSIPPSSETSVVSSTDNDTDDATLEPIQQRDYPQEESIECKLPVQAVATPAAAVEFCIIDESSQRNSNKLCDRVGFTYVYHYTTSKSIKIAL